MRTTSGVPLFVVWLVGVSGLVVTAGVSSAGPSSGQGRLRPPAFVTCDRNHLTAFSGTVVSLTRDSGTTTLRMETDENTKEAFTLRHPGADATAWFYLAGQPFTQADWAALLPGGKLRPDARATVWVCDDQANPRVDWSLPARKQP